MFKSNTTGLSFAEAVDAMKRGKHVRRPRWDKKFNITEGFASIVNWDDVTADDWNIVA